MSLLWNNFVRCRATSGQTGAALVLLWLVATAQAQEAIRMSQASQEAAQARSEAVSMLRDSNLRLGPSFWRLSTTLGIEVRDNATLSEKDPKADVLVRPQLNARMWWPLTEKNSLNVSVGLGYMKYLSTSDAGNVYVPSGSELSFDLFVGDCIINFHDRFTIHNDAYENPALSEARYYQRLENVPGIAATWDLNKIKLQAGYDHADYISLNSTLSQADGRLESFYARAGYALGRTTVAGLEGGINLVDYSDPTIRDAIQYNAGPFWEGRLTENIRFKASAGYTLYAPFDEGTVGVSDDTGSVYGQLLVSHRLNHLLTYSLSGGRYVQSGLQWGLAGRNLNLSYVRWQGDWNLLQNFRISTPFFYERGEESGAFEDNFNRYGGGFSVGRMLAQKLYGSIGYTFTRRDSSQPGRSYDLNIVSLNFTYTF